MPTGYTAPVADGDITDVKDFAAGCARGFGAFIHQRDHSAKDVLRMPEPPSEDSYYFKALGEANAEQARWGKLSEEERYAEWSAYVQRQRVGRHKSKAGHAKMRARYENMLAQVHSVDVPAELENFKQFMIDQLESSIKFDCGSDDGSFEDAYYRVLPFHDWSAHTDVKVRHDVEYWTEEYKDEWRRYHERVQYINLMVETYGFEVEK